jgi:hypothetical protein
MRLFVSCLSILLAIAGVLFAQSAYRDPDGRFSLTVPAGWTVSNQQGMVQLRSGNSYTLVTVLDGGGDDPHRIARFTDEFGKEWRSYRRMKTGFVPIGGTDFAYAIYTGVNARGVEALVKAISAPLGSSAIVVLTFCPVEEWPGKRAAVEDIIEGKFSLGSARANSRPGPGTNPPPINNPGPPAGVPRSRKELPQGFTIRANNGEFGQALTATFSAEFAGRSSATKAFSGVYPLVAAYFDSPPRVQAAIADAQDTQVDAFFSGVWHGARVRGFMVLAVEGGKGYSGVVFDREDLAARSLPPMIRQLTGAFGPTNASAPGGAPARPKQLTQTTLPDGSGAVGLPPGWRIANAYKGTVDLLGPNGEAAFLGAYNAVFVNPLPGIPPNQPTGPYRSPAAALALHYDVTTQRSLSRGTMRFRVLEQTPVQAQGGEAAYIAYEVTSQTHSYQGLAMVWTRPVDASQWMYFYSLVSAPTQNFAQELPSMWAMWKSWTVNPAVYRERMDQALQSMRETYKIIQGVNANQQRTYDNVNTAWSQAIRGVTTIEDIAGQRRWDIDTNFAQDVVNRLNEQGQQFRVVPLPELVR